ncbi:MAG: sodium/proline symporter [Lachnospiraceae bacterium]|nr:sodium/proline symporter [Lachnospiraceae bacterium]
MSANTIMIIIAIVGYLLLTLFIGIRFSRSNRDTGDFYLGGRKLGPFVTAMSAEASDMSSYLLMGLPGLAYLSGLADVAWTAIGLAIGTWLNWLIVARRIRHYSQEIGAITIPEFFSKRYHDEKNVLTLIAGIVIVIFFIPYTASGFAACGKLFSSLFGVDYIVAMIVFAAVIIAYTTLGGFLAASTSDLIQSIVMTVALIVILGFGISMAGGMDKVIENARALPGYLAMNQTYVADTGSAAPYGPITVISTMAWGLGYFGMPHILLRFMAIKDRGKLVLSRRIASVWVVISMGIAILIGIVGLGASAAGAIPALSGSGTETVIIELSSRLSQNGILPALIAGIVLAGILAATMSTADSQLLAASSSVSENIVSQFLKREMSKRKSLIIARVTVIIISVIAVFLARDPDSNIFTIVSFAWAGFGAAFGPVVLLALFWRKGNKYGAIFGMAAGGIMVFLWKYLVRPIGGAFNIYELLPAFVVALLVNIIVSLATGGAKKEVTKEYDKIIENYKKA